MHKLRKHKLRKHKYTQDEFFTAVAKSRSIRQIAINLGIHSSSSGNYATIKRRLQEWNVDTSHFKGQGWLKNHTHQFNTRPLDEFLASNPPSTRVKERLWREGILSQECAECKTGATWNNKPLVLQLDHIDGDNKNNHIDNLRILCPNCHTQTSTFTSRKLRKAPSMRPRRNNNPRKVEWPSPEELATLLWQMPTTAIGKRYGVSDTTVSKWAKQYNLSKPARGYWARLASA
ncbi:MAG: hypothetical protein JSS66_07205 [Armatimonadetes bacterium]|nr:hypothetical protein [Armatimonadota bacterium]